MVITTRGQEALGTSDIPNIETLTPCDHEEADTRMLLHAAHMKYQGFTNIVIRTNDTDVLVLAIASQVHLNFAELWLSFGTGRSHKFIPVHDAQRQVGRSTALALPGFHAFTGCDQISSFWKKGKNRAWEIWQMYPEFTQAFVVLSGMRPTKESVDAVFPLINQYAARLWQTDDQYHCVDMLRMHQFVHKGKSFDTMPPGSDALKQHTYRAAYQGGHIWGATLVATMNPPSPKDWGWSETPRKWIPNYTQQEIISEKLPVLKSCGCQKKCEPPCTCAVLKMPCTGLCGCEGGCFGKPRPSTAPQ